MSRISLLSAFCSVVVYWTTLLVNIRTFADFLHFHCLLYFFFFSYLSSFSSAFLLMPDSASFFSGFFIRSFSLVVSSFFLFHLPIRFVLVLCFFLLPSSVTFPSSSPVAFLLLHLCTCLFSSHSVLPVAFFPRLQIDRNVKLALFSI